MLLYSLLVLSFLIFDLTVKGNYDAHIFEEGQNATLKCEVIFELQGSEWNETWQTMTTEEQQVLCRKEDSGVYRCCLISNATSQSNQIYILSKPDSGSLGLAAAAMFLSLLALLLFIALALWLWLHRVKETSSSTNRNAEPNDYGSKNTHSPAVDDGDIYMNTLEIEQAYSDLNPGAEDQSYATLS